MATMRYSTHSVTLEVPSSGPSRTSPTGAPSRRATNFVKGVRQEAGQLYMTTPFGGTGRMADQL